MKRIFTLMLCLTLCLSLCACAGDDKVDNPVNSETQDVTENITPEDSSNPVEKEEENQEESESADENAFVAMVVKSSYSDSEKIESLAEPTSLVSSGDVNYPVYMIRSITELETFINNFSDVLDLGSTEEENSFLAVIQQFNNHEYFEDKSLMIAYVTSVGNTTSYNVGGMSVLDTELNMDIIAKTVDEDEPTVENTTMTGYIAIARVYNHIIENCDSFTASRVIE